MRGSCVLLIPILTLGAMTGACGSASDRQPTILEARLQPYVVDIPVPSDFRLKPRLSEHRRTAGRREVRHIYEGRSDPIAVRNFYEHYMPDSGWEMVDDTLKKGHGVFLLNYIKSGERCEIRIERAPAPLFGQVTHIIASLQPNTPPMPRP
ncbi:MAG: hypothetical protein ACE5F9_10465 [Phycisphaerae bacterium]